MGLKLSVLLSGRLPTEYCHGNVVGAAQITLHLFLQIGKRIEAQIVIETLLIVSVAPFNLAVVPRCSRSEDMVMNAEVKTEVPDNLWTAAQKNYFEKTIFEVLSGKTSAKEFEHNIRKYQ